MDYVVGSESPRSFHRWAALGCVAAAMQRKCYMRWGHTTIYPNNYIILVGPSGQTRKGEPVMLARSFAEALQIPLVPEDTSMEKLIRRLRQTATNYEDKDTGTIMIQSSVAGFLEELAVLIGEQNTKFLAYLTNWYDSRDSWTRETKHQGDDDLAGVCFNLVAATAPDWIPYMFTREAIGGGFTSRCLFVVADRKAQIVDDPDRFPINQELKTNLIHDLEHIHAMTGEFVFEPRAKKRYQEWYRHDEENIRKGFPVISDPYFAGYISRRATHVKKISMALAAAQSNRRIISLDHFDRAVRGMLELEKLMPKAFVGVGKPKYIQETDLVMNYIKERGQCTKAEILRNFRRFLDDYTLEAAIKVMMAMDLVSVHREAPSGRITYSVKKGAKW